MTTKIEKEMVGGSMGVVEVGDLTWSARSTKAGWLLCQGQAVSRVVYTALFLAIGTAFGAGDGSTTFNLPDSQGRGMIGVGAGAGLTARAMGAKGGEETHQLTTAEMPSHNHGVTDPGHIHGLSTGNPSTSGSYAANTTGSLNVTPNTNSATTGISIQNNGGGGAHNNMPPFLSANLFIYAGV